MTEPSVPIPLDQSLSVPGGQVFLRRWAYPHSSRPPLILLHDSLGSVEQWRDFPPALALATKRDVLAYDRLGFGKSSPRADRPTARFVQEEADGFFPILLAALRLPRFALFGHSVGGAMALLIAAAQPGACAAVITESAQAFVEPQTLASIRAARDSFRDPAQFEKLVRWHGERAAWVLAAWTDVWLSPQFAGFSLLPRLSEVTCPVLAIHGDRDEYGSTAFPRSIAAGVAGPSELAILSDCGHLPHREQREQVLQRVRSFFDQFAI
jgi:pimeloyl-ACP methyl ester carboxylesterase